MFQIWDKSVSNMLIVAAGEEVLLSLHLSMGTVWADTALFGQPVLAISAVSILRFTVFHCTQIFCSSVILFRAKYIQVYFVFLLFLSNRLDTFLVAFIIWLG